MISVNNKN